MAQDTNIEWTDKSWNFLRGCSRVSEGCRNCYAERTAVRFAKPGEAYHGLVNSTPAGPRWTGKVEFFEHILLEPLKWRKPCRVFVNSMSDLFHEDVSDEWLDKAFAVMALTPQHTYQILTKRPERMREYLSFTTGKSGDRYNVLARVILAAREIEKPKRFAGPEDFGWPYKNIWLGVSVEDQKTADERIPLLLQTPAAVRWISAEPMLSEVNLTWLKATLRRSNAIDALGGQCFDAGERDDNGHWMYDGAKTDCSKLDWIVTGGESGPNARPCDIAWIRSIVEQCKAAGVACFVKQLGANIRSPNDTGFEGDDDRSWPMDTDFEEHPNGYRQDWQGDPVRIRLRSKKGGDPSEWPEDLRIREMPGAADVV